MKKPVIFSFPSPNWNERTTGMTPNLIIIHYTDMLNSKEALRRLCEPSSAVSAHYLIEKNGKIYRLVHDKYRAWHAGVSSWQGETSINCQSIGIELDYPGHCNDQGREFPRRQIVQLIVLLNYLCRRYSISPDRILGHSDVAPTRKQDPGENFPWALLANKGLGLGKDSFKGNLLEYNEESKTSPLLSLQESQVILRSIGYKCPTHGQNCEETRLVFLAFQRHFLPNHLSGELCPATENLLKWFKIKGNATLQ